MTDEETEKIREPRTFTQDVERANVAFLVQVPTRELERFAQLVEDAINEVSGRYVFSKASNRKLFIMEPSRDDDRDDRSLRPRRSFSYGTDR